MPTINFVREGKKVQVEVGASLRYAALDNDIPLYTKMVGGAKFINCHGNGLCGTDEVIVSPANVVNCGQRPIPQPIACRESGEPTRY